jgi:hypothetical protein
MSLAALPGLVVAAAPPDPQTVEAIRTYIRSELSALQVPEAVVVIVHGDEIVFAEGFGIAQPDGTPASCGRSAICVAGGWTRGRSHGVGWA